MMKITKALLYIICILPLPGSSSALFADDQKAISDFLSKKIYKETRDEHDRSVRSALRFSSAPGSKLNSALNFGHIEKIYIPYQTNITPAQISYLFQNAIFKKYDELPPLHLTSTGTFKIILKNYSVLEFHTYAGAPMIRVALKTDIYWLEIPHYEIFSALGEEKESNK
jgi:hypothetical protein